MIKREITTKFITQMNKVITWQVSYIIYECAINEVLRRLCNEKLRKQWVKLIIANNKLSHCEISHNNIFVCARLRIQTRLTLDKRVCLSPCDRLKSGSEKKNYLSSFYTDCAAGGCGRRRILLVGRVYNATQLCSRSMSICASRSSALVRRWRSRLRRRRNLNVVYSSD